MKWDITDINTCLGYQPGVRTQFESAEGLLSAMDTYRITRAVVVHTDSLRDAVRGNSLALDASRNSNGRLSPCYVLRSDLGGSEMPSADGLMAQLRTERPAAVKLYPKRDGYVLDEFYAGGLLDVLNELGLPLLLDSDQRPPYEHFPALVNRYPCIPFVLLRQPMNHSRFTRALLAGTENVYFDISIMVDACFIEEAVEAFGGRRFLFGSALPVFQPAGALGMVVYSRISDEDKQAVFSGNWRRLQEEIRWE